MTGFVDVRVPPTWMGWSQLARHAGVSVDTLRRWAARPGFPPISYPSPHRPRICRLCFDAWLSHQTAGHPGVDAVITGLRGQLDRRTRSGVSVNA